MNKINKRRNHCQFGDSFAFNTLLINHAGNSLCHPTNSRNLTLHVLENLSERMSARSGEEPKRKRLKQTSIEESFSRHRSSLNSPYLKGNKETQEIQIMQNTTSSEEELRQKRNLIADAAEKRRGSLCTGTSATSTASSDMVAEGDSKNGISDVEDSPAIEFDDSPLLFPELGTPLESLNRIPSCLQPLSPLVAQPDHTVLVRPLLSGDFALPPTPSHVNYRDKWDKNHVRMPCSRENLYPGQINKFSMGSSHDEIVEKVLGHMQMKCIVRFFDLKKEFENGRTTVASAGPGHYGKSKVFLSAKTWFQKLPKQ
ncbi:Poly(ADP-ribose) glycohydrolase [Acropora cervicornis]|uniref:Poly(ADP-ribose) glycohydrolase n=1 Tax=Acropora cervicornis TaxID=6130 RepID=A0AAD9QSA7_ACRCE|nr:Poly(ADP-ribose) glycohydrolase [Acropora cervicornis]